MRLNSVPRFGVLVITGVCLFGSSLAWAQATAAAQKGGARSIHPMANPANALDSVGADHNKLLGELILMTASNTEELWKRQVQFANRRSGRKPAAGEEAFYRLGSAEAMLRQLPRQIVGSRSLIESALRFINMAGARSDSYESLARMLIAEEMKTTRNPGLKEPQRSALLAGLSTARFSASFHANRTGATDGGVETLKIKWKEIWGKIKEPVAADFAGAVTGCLTTLVDGTWVSQECGQGALAGGAISSLAVLKGSK